MSESLVKRVDDGPIAILALDRPDCRNALSRALMNELADQLDQSGHDPRVRAVVLTGAGSVFCSGMDLKEAALQGNGSEAEQNAVATLQEYADLVQKLHTLSKPTIAALNGDALAGGAGLMAACDFAVASEAARIGYPEVFRGLVPAVVMYDLTRLIGDRRARQLLLTGELIMSTQAYHWGLINQVTTADRCLAEAVRVGKYMIPSAPGAVAAIKRLLDETQGRPKSLRGAAAVSAAIRVSEEAQEGIHAFIEKRPPRWVETHP
jgi:methylglutaconyl-CoA hydratase